MHGGHFVIIGNSLLLQSALSFIWVGFSLSLLHVFLKKEPMVGEQPWAPDAQSFGRIGTDRMLDELLQVMKRRCKVIIAPPTSLFPYTWAMQCKHPHYEQENVLSHAFSLRVLIDSASPLVRPRCLWRDRHLMHQSRGL